MWVFCGNCTCDGLNLFLRAWNNEKVLVYLFTNSYLWSCWQHVRGRKIGWALPLHLIPNTVRGDRVAGIGVLLGGVVGQWKMGSASREGKVIRKWRGSFKNSVRIWLPFEYVWVLWLQNINTAWLLRTKVCSYHGTRSESRVISIVQIRQWFWGIPHDIELSKKGDRRRKTREKGYNCIFLTVWSCQTVA